MIIDVICKIYFTLFIDACGNLRLAVIKLVCVCSWSTLGAPTEYFLRHPSALPFAKLHPTQVKLLDVHNFLL